MTSHNIYSIYDRKAQYYLPPFACRGDAEAHRTFAEAVSTSETPLSIYPADFDLVRLAQMDLETGAIIADSMPALLINGLVALEAAHAQRRRYAAILKNGAEPDVEQFVENLDEPYFEEKI